MAQPKEFPRLSGTVKSVLSGDTIVIRGPARNGPPPERTIVLSGVTAPRLARRPSPGEANPPVDEPCAWEAREFLRKMLVGKTVQFTSEHTTPTGREYGTVFPAPGQSAALLLAAEGLVTIREIKGTSEEHEALKAASAVAQAAGKGIFSKTASKTVRKVTWELENPRGLVDKHAGTPVRFLVEQVRDGCTLRGFLLPTFQYATVMLTGIKTPTIKYEGDKEIAEPFAEEARFYVDSRLLQREVELILEGADKGNLLATVRHPAGNIAEFLLKDGLAKVVDWSIGMVSSGREKLREAEKAAKAARLRIWHTYVPSAASAAVGAGERQFTAIVEEIVSADSIVVSVHGTSKKLFLSSIRGPKKATGSGEEPAAGARRPLYDTPYLFEAREYLRTKLIGQKVDVTVDYVKPAEPGFPEKTCATVLAGATNVAEALVAKGLATVQRHRADDDARAAGYDNLLAAEARAVKNGYGVHASGEPPVHRVTEINSKAQADRFLPSLQRAGRVSAIVEHVAAGARLRVFVGKETCAAQVLLAGVSCPRSGSAQGPGEPFGDQAAAFTRAKALQRDVGVEFVDADRNGNLVAHVFVQGESLAEALLAHGYATLHASAERYSGHARLAAAEESAKSKRIGLWLHYDAAAAQQQQQQQQQQQLAEQQQQQQQAEQQTERTPTYVRSVVSHVVDGTTLCLQGADAIAQLDGMMHELNEHFATAARAGAYAPKKGEKVAAIFSEDGAWYRALVLKVGANAMAEVRFVDYGNSEEVPFSKLAPLPTPAALHLPPFAREVTLAYIGPAAQDYRADATELLSSLVMDAPVYASVEYRDPTTHHESVNLRSAPDASGEDLCLALVAAGMATVLPARRERHLQPMTALYAGALAAAKRAHRGMWKFGDATEDDAKEFGWGKKK